MFLGYFIGLLVGVILGLLGGGGSLLVVALYYLIGIRPIGLASAYITILVGITALFGVIPRIKRKEVDWQTAVALGLPVTAGALLVRLWLIAVIPDVLFTVGSVDVTKKMFVLLLVASLLLLSFATMVGLIGKNIKSKANLRNERPIVYYAALAICGLVIGILPAFSGAGGGVLIVPLLVIFFGLPIKTVVGTCLAIVMVKSFVGFFAGDLVRLGGTVDYPFLGKFAAVMIVGAWIGSRLSQVVDAERLKKIFAWFLLGLAIFIFINEVFNAT